MLFSRNDSLLAKSAALRVMGRTTKTAAGCWEWRGAKTRTGYGRAWIGVPFNKNVYTHRLLYATFIGPIADDKVAAHKCDNPSCCNPSHLLACSQAENLADAISKGRFKAIRNRRAEQTHCRKGHIYSPDNVYMRSGRIRNCKICRRTQQRKSK